MPRSSDGSFGGLAQLVERLLCKQDVSGSSPLTSTDRSPATECGSRRMRPRVIETLSVERSSASAYSG